MILKPSFGQIAECELASAPGVIQAGNLIPEFIQPAAGQGGVLGLEGLADLLARSFEQGIVRAR